MEIHFTLNRYPIVPETFTNKILIWCKDTSSVHEIGIIVLNFGELRYHDFRYFSVLIPCTRTLRISFVSVKKNL